MPKLRYAIAALFFAASVGCLALWWRSMTYLDRAEGPIYVVSNRLLYVESFHGIGVATWLRDDLGQFADAHWIRPEPTTERIELDLWGLKEKGLFGYSDQGLTVFFPLWYPALVSALACVAVLRFRRQFSIRSALIGLAVVAALLGMVVAL